MTTQHTSEAVLVIDSDRHTHTHSYTPHLSQIQQLIHGKKQSSPIHCCHRRPAAHQTSRIYEILRFLHLFSWARTKDDLKSPQMEVVVMTGLPALQVWVAFEPLKGLHLERFLFLVYYLTWKQPVKQSKSKWTFAMQSAQLHFPPLQSNPQTDVQTTKLTL